MGRRPVSLSLINPGNAKDGVPKPLETIMNNPLEPKGFTGFGYGHYCITAAWPEDTRPMTAGDHPANPQTSATRALNHLGYFGPGTWADAEGGLIASGCIDADL